MAIVKYKNQSGITYAYESISEWDPVKKQSRPKRKYLGRVAPETGEIIPTAGKRGRPKKNSNMQEEKAADYKSLFENASATLKKFQADLRRLKKEKEELAIQNQQLTDLISLIYQQTGSFLKKN